MASTSTHPGLTRYFFEAFAGWYTITYVPSSLLRHVLSSIDSRGHMTLTTVSAVEHDHRSLTKLENRSMRSITSNESVNASVLPIRGSRDESNDRDCCKSTFRHIPGELRMTTEDIIPVSSLAADENDDADDDASKPDIRRVCSRWVYTLIPLMCKKDSHIDPTSASSCSASCRSVL